MGSGNSNSGGGGGGGGGGAPTQNSPGGPPEKLKNIDNSPLSEVDADVKPGGVLTGPGVKAEQLSPQDAASISAYTGMQVPDGERFAGLNAEKVNRSLYDPQGFVNKLKSQGRTPSEIDDLVKRAGQYERELNRSLSKLRSYEGEVYRTIDDAGGSIADQFVPGQTVSMKGFTSTSRSTNPSYMPFAKAKSGKTRFVIKSKTGKSIEKVSEYAEEREVLFGTKAKFSVRSNTYNEARGTRDIYLEEI